MTGDSEVNDVPEFLTKNSRLNNQSEIIRLSTYVLFTKAIVMINSPFLLD